MSLLSQLLAALSRLFNLHSSSAATPTLPSITLVASGDATVAGNLTLTAAPSASAGLLSVAFYRGATRLDTQATPPYALAVPLTSADNGVVAFSAVAKDVLGRLSPPALVAVTVAIPLPDTEVPAVALSASANPLTVPGPLILTAAATDNVAVASVQFFRADTSLGAAQAAPPYSATENVSRAENGSYLYRALAVDTSGNATEATLNVLVNIPEPPDTTPPSLSLSASPNPVTAAGPVEVLATASDAGGIDKVLFYRGAALIQTERLIPYRTTLNLGRADGDSASIRVVAYDLAGNTTERSITIPITIPPDTTGPDVPLGLSNDGNQFRLRFMNYSGPETPSSYRTYSRRAASDIERFLVAETTLPATVYDAEVMDGVQVWYSVYAVINGAEVALTTASGVQPARSGWTGPLTITAPGTYELMVKSSDPSLKAVTIAPGVTGVTLRGRIAAAGTAIFGSAGSGVLLDNLRLHGLHPGIAESLQGKGYDGDRPASFEMQNSYTEGFKFPVYIDGGNGMNLQRLRIQNNVFRNAQGLKTTATGYHRDLADNRHTQSGVAHFIQINGCQGIASADISRNLLVQEPGQGFVEDPINLYRSSCVAGNWGQLAYNAIYGGYSAGNIATTNYAGAGIIWDGDSASTRFWEAHHNTVLDVTNGGVSALHAWDVWVHDNYAACAGLLEDGSTIYATNNGFTAYDFKSSDPIQRVRMTNNTGFYARPPNSANNKNASWYKTLCYFTSAASGRAGNDLQYASNPRLADVTVAQIRARYRDWLSEQRAAGVQIGPLAPNGYSGYRYPAGAVAEMS